MTTTHIEAILTVILWIVITIIGLIVWYRLVLRPDLRPGEKTNPKTVKAMKVIYWIFGGLALIVPTIVLIILICR